MSNDNDSHQPPPPSDDWFPSDDHFPGDDITGEQPEQLQPANNTSSGTVRTRIVSRWFEIASAALTTDADVATAESLISQLRTASVLYEALGATTSSPLQGALAHVTAVLGDFQYGSVRLDALGLTDTAWIQPDVADVFKRIGDTTPAARPESVLAGITSEARKEISRVRSAQLISAIETGAQPEELAVAHSAVADAPPTALDNGNSHGGNDSVSALFVEEGNGSSTDIALSSGFPSLDVALSTRSEFARSYVRSGQLCVFVAPSGSGKTSAFNTIVPAGVSDAKRQGNLGRTLYIHNEDDTADIFQSMGISPGRKYANLADDIAFLKTTSREDFIKFFYREVLQAKRRSVETGLPVSMFMPPTVFIDYYQALTSPADKGNEVVSTSTTADLLLYGVANCDPVACKTFSGIGFQEFTGESWPAELGNFTIAVVATAQLLLKGSSSQSPYDPNKRDANWRNYAAADALDNPAWEAQAGDYPLAKLDDIRGATKIIQNATTIIGLHRPRPRNNPEVGVNAAGYRTLADTRGFFTILKARFGQRMLVVPVEFNLQRNGGSKACYIDAAAEAAIAQGGLSNFDEELFNVSGDPIVPKRERRSKMAAVRY